MGHFYPFSIAILVYWRVCVFIWIWLSVGISFRSVHVFWPAARRFFFWTYTTQVSTKNPYNFIYWNYFFYICIYTVYILLFGPISICTLLYIYIYTQYIYILELVFVYLYIISYHIISYIYDIYIYLLIWLSGPISIYSFGHNISGRKAWAQVPAASPVSETTSR
jgi:hypothetical protein